VLVFASSAFPNVWKTWEIAGTSILGGGSLEHDVVFVQQQNEGFAVTSD
jgi:hypothetical protein